MKIKIKKLNPNAKMPTQGTAGAAGFDLYAAEEFDVTIFEEQTVRIQTGLAFEIPEGYVGVVYSRSSTALKGLIITPLLVDADYRGPVYVTVKNASGRPYVLRNGDRIAQMRIEELVPTEFEWADELSETERGAGGYGSTGR
jgi:dUTP pyrophosphatase|nr:MAG TPA: dUTPase [Caudoviricetes sp.]